MNLYDYDAVQTPGPRECTFKGQPRKLIVTANRNGFLYILDRTNGKFLFAKPFMTLRIGPRAWTRMVGLFPPG